MVSIEYANAYAEVLQILKNISIDEYNKVPKEKIELFEKYYNKKFDFKYNPHQTLQEQNVSKIARTIIAILFRDYWATDEQRKQILLEEDEEKRKKLQKYSADNLFKSSNKVTIKDETISNNMSIVEYKDSIFKKLINKIKKFFEKNI